MTKIVKFGNSFNNNELSFLSICCCYSIYVILDVVSWMVGIEKNTKLVFHVQRYTDHSCTEVHRLTQDYIRSFV